MNTAFERDFIAALWPPAEAGAAGALPAFARHPAFAVYRNNIASACIDALAANYPTVRQLVGEAWFREVAGAFARSHPPLDGRLARYGDGFASFLAAAGPARELPYLPGVAQLDRGWTECHLAADAPLLAVADLVAWTPETLVATVLVPHPAARWVTCEDAPVFTIWRRHREAGDPGADLRWCGESALLVRPAGEVAWQALDAAAAGFLDHCRAGRPLGDALAASDLPPQALPGLIAAGAFARPEPAAPAGCGMPSSERP